KGKHLPIVAMTAAAMLDDRRKTQLAGMNGHVAKPIDIEELVNVLVATTNDLPATEEYAGSSTTSPLAVTPATGTMTALNTLTLAGINTGAVLKRFGGDSDLLLRTMAVFASSFQSFAYDL